MHYTITGRHVDLTPAIRQHIEERIGRFEKYFHRIVEVHAVLTVERKHRHVAEITIQAARGLSFFGKVESDDMYRSIDQLIMKIEHQLERRKDKIKSHKVRESKRRETGAK